MNIKKIEYYLKKYNIKKNENNYKNIVNIYNYSGIKYNFDLTFKEKIILLYTFLGKKKTIQIGGLIFLEIILIILWINLVFNQNFRRYLENEINNYLHRRRLRNPPFFHPTIGIQTSVWRKIEPIYTNYIQDLFNYTLTHYPNDGQFLFRYLRKTAFKEIYKKEYINRYLQLIIENFKNKIKLRKEILNVSKKTLMSKTKLPSDIINNILTFMDKVIIN